MTEKQISNEELMALEIDRKNKNIDRLHPNDVDVGILMLVAQSFIQARVPEKESQEKNDHDKKAS
jgi:hypothetical protein